MDELFNEEPYIYTTTTNLHKKIKHYIINKYFKELVTELRSKNLITDNDVEKIYEDYFSYMIDNIY